MDIEATVKQITGPCSCHDSYTSRRMVDPGCTFHELSADIVDALRKAQDEALKWKEAYREVAINCEDRYWEDAPHDQCVKNVDAEARRIVDGK